MTLQGQTLFPPGGELRLTVDVKDFIGNVGNILYDAYGSDESGGKVRFLLPSNIAPSIAGAEANSNLLAVNLGTFSGNMAKRADIDYDLAAYKSPVVIGGDIFVRVPMELNHGSGAGNRTVKFVIIAKHVDSDTTETVLDTQETAQTTVPDTALFNPTIKLNTADTKFNKGDHFRITVEYWLEDNSGTSALWEIHDPTDSGADRNWDNGTTRFTVAVPYKILI